MLFQSQGIGLLFIFYSLHWCCCLRRFKIDRKDHPAPQWAACGWAPLVVVVQEVPEDPTKAIWSDELQQISADRLDAKVYKDKNMLKKFKGLEAKCFGSFDVQDPLMNRLMAFCDDSSIWEDVKIEKAAKMNKTKKPKEPKGLSPLKSFEVESTRENSATLMPRVFLRCSRMAQRFQRNRRQEKMGYTSSCPSEVQSRPSRVRKAAEW